MPRRGAAGTTARVYPGSENMAAAGLVLVRLLVLAAVVSTLTALNDPTCECPDGFKLCAGHCLRRLDRALTYDEARIMCAGLGAHLAVPRTEAENQCADSAAAGQLVWLGVTEVPGDEGHYVGADACGDVPVGQFWASGQPENYGPRGEDRVVMVPHDSGTVHAVGWHDNPAEQEWHPLCQRSLFYRPDCLN
ncbi:brevican core protein-like [Amphibalanus amphitrite]|nr:brevican core protein-like [Amphibalanus amphitrite]